MKYIAVGLAISLVILSGCRGGGGGNHGRIPSSLFIEGCPVPGKSQAKMIDNPFQKMYGPDALGGQGDYLLMNNNAAFIIDNPDNQNTYMPYGGILIDAVAIEKCSQASLERFEEMGLVIGMIDTVNFLNSTIRAFHGESAEILNDGSDGNAAVLRVHGSDDIFWIVELQIIAMLNSSGVTKPVGGPINLDVWVDYILEPDSNILRIEYNFHNTDIVQKKIFAGTALFFGDSTELKFYSMSLESMLGFDVPLGVPWEAASGGDGAWVFSMTDSLMATINLGGVMASLDSNQLADPMILEPNGDDGDTAMQTYFFGVGGGDFNSGLKAMYESNPDPIPELNPQFRDFDGYTYDIQTQKPMGNVYVELQALNLDDEWVFIDGFFSDKKGLFGGVIPDIGSQLRLVAHVDGRPDPLPAYFYPDQVSHIDVGFMPGGTLLYDVRDEIGRNIPAKIILWQGGDMVKRVYSTDGYGQIAMPAGNYDVSVTRGFEYTTYQGNVDIYADQLTPLQVSIERAVDTTGFMSVDVHMHAAPSPDNIIPVPDRIASVAAEGLEITISTDHEFVDSWQFGIDETGLGDWVATVIGQEVTAPMPGHSNIYPIVPDYDINVRGEYVQWGGLNMAEIFAAERARGAQIISINHPRETGMCVGTRYNRLTGLPGPGRVWSWDFNTVEYMNGTRNVFVNTGNPNNTGAFDDWMSFLNFGHKITAVGGSDVHDYNEPPGYPRNYFLSSTDEPSEFNQDDLVTAMLEGRVVASVGAFARVEVNGAAEIGDTITDTDGAVSVWVHIEAIPEIDVTYFKVFVNCDQVADVPTTAPDEVVKYDDVISVPVTSDAHIEVLGFGENSLPIGMPQFDPTYVPRFTTNAIYIDTDDGLYDPPMGKGCTYTVP